MTAQWDASWPALNSFTSPELRPSLVMGMLMKLSGDDFSLKEGSPCYRMRAGRQTRRFKSVREKKHRQHGTGVDILVDMRLQRCSAEMYASGGVSPIPSAGVAEMSSPGEPRNLLSACGYLAPFKSRLVRGAGSFVGFAEKRGLFSLVCVRGMVSPAKR